MTFKLNIALDFHRVIMVEEIKLGGQFDFVTVLQ